MHLVQPSTGSFSTKHNVSFLCNTSLVTIRFEPHKQQVDLIVNKIDTAN